MQVTEHFRSEEFACHDGTPYPAGWMDRLRVLCELLEEIRSTVVNGRAIVITSGYRTLEYNRRIGSRDGSFHVQGEAADIRIPGVGTAVLHSKILGYYHRGALSILGGLGAYPRFVHVDIRLTDRLVRWAGSRTV